MSRILGLLGLLIAAGLFVAGLQALRDPVYRSGASLDIPRPAKVIYLWIADPARQLKWVDGLVESAPERRGPPRVGVIWRQRIVLGGREFPERVEILACDPPRILTWRAVMAGGYVSTVSWSLSETGTTTTIRVTDDTRYVSRLSRALGVFALGPTNRKLTADLRRLKDLLVQPFSK